MTKEELIVDSRKIIDKFVNNFKADKMDDRDRYLYSLLKELIIIEPTSISTDILLSQLKESYFQTDLATSLFLVKLYTKKEDTMSEYIDIYLEQIVENTLTLSDIKNKVNTMRSFVSINFPDLLPLYDQKAIEYGNNYKA